MSLSFTTRNKIIVTCPKFISSYLRDEIQDLGYAIEEEWSTGVSIMGSLNDCIRLNFYLRTGNQVLYLIDSFKCNNPTELYENVRKIKWEEIIKVDGYFCITSNVNHPTIDNNLFANVRVKDAIADHFMELKKMRPDSGSDRNKTVIHLFWNNDEAQIYIDTSGRTLAKHHYRMHPGKAPMQEGLAAATIMSTKWDTSTNFINPMCGSGTLAIEAALIALNRPPGLYRSNYAYMHVLGYEEAYYEEVRKKANEQKIRKLTGHIIATDNDPKVIQSAISNATTAGVDHLIEFSVCDFSETLVPEGGGVVMFNPEYGERLGEFEELEKVYKGMGDFLKQKCKGYRGYILTASPNLAKKVGLKASRKTEFFNSKLECRLLEYELYDGTRREPKGESESESI